VHANEPAPTIIGREPPHHRYSETPFPETNEKGADNQSIIKGEKDIWKEKGLQEGDYS